MRERDVEQKLVAAVRRVGGLAPKFVSPGLDGVPDRLILLPGACFAFAELKAPGKSLRPLQRRRKPVSYTHLDVYKRQVHRRRLQRD